MAENANSKSWLKWLIIILILVAVVWFIASLYRTSISSMTHGAIFGPGLDTISEDDLLSEKDKPTITESQFKDYANYSRSLYKEKYRRLDDKKTQVVDELRAVSLLAARANAGKIQITKENVNDLFKDALKEINDSKGGFWSNLIPSAWALEPDPTEAIDHATLHNMAVGLMLDGHYDIALVLAALCAADMPQNTATANLLANLLRQSENDYDALELVKFALQQDPENEAILITMGMIYLDLNKIPLARRTFNRALAISEGRGGPANQGMMLVSLAEGDLGGAYLYMLEGAKEGYTAIITRTYNKFLKAYGGYKQYLKFAGPILDQYGYEHLTDFKRTRLAFDPTLDTVGQQIMADRTFVLPSTAPQVISSAVISLDAAIEHMKFMFQTMFSDIDLSSVVTENGIDFDKLFKSESFGSLLSGTGIDPGKLSKGIKNIQNHIDKDGNLDVGGVLGGLIKDQFSSNEPVEVIRYGEENYEQEEFWLNILYDYTFYKYEELTKKYYKEPAETYFVGAVDKSMKDLEKQTDIFSKKADENPIGTLMGMLQNMIENGSPIANEKYTDEQVNKMTERFCPLNPIMKEGYTQAIMLAEHYWLVTQNILGLIGNDKIYNKHHARRNTLAASILSYFPMAAGISNGMMGLLSNTWGGITFDWNMNGKELKSGLDKYIKDSNAIAKYPKVIQFPITGMGKEVKPKLVVRVVVPKPKAVADKAKEIYKKKKAENPEYITDDDDGMCIMLRPGHESMADVFLTDTWPQSEAPEPNNPRPQAVDDDDDDDAPPHTETIEDVYVEMPKPVVGFKISSLLSYQTDPATGKSEFGLGWFVGGIKAGFDPQSGDLYLYGQAGPDLSTDVVTGGGGVLPKAAFKATLFLKGTVNIFEMAFVSADVGADGEVRLGSKAAVADTVSYDPVLGIKRETAIKVVDGLAHRIRTDLADDDDD